MYMYIDQRTMRRGTLQSVSMSVQVLSAWLIHLVFA